MGCRFWVARLYLEPVMVDSPLLSGCVDWLPVCQVCLGG
jgi:hypothetical protein